MHTRLARGVTLTAEHGPADFGMERDLVVLPAVIADYVETLGSILADARFLRSAFGTALRRHHVALIEHLLFLFREQKDLLTLHTRNFYIRHR
ncbi:MAG TPA: hypothetical protein VGJ02_00345 [Pyrinomonadaceae bacterium]